MSRLLLFSFAFIFCNLSSLGIFPDFKTCSAHSILERHGIQAIVFDAYGTLLDEMSVPRLSATTLHLPNGFAELWRQKQLSYSWIRTIMKRYVDFWQITEDAMNYSLNFYNRTLSSHDRQYLLKSYLFLKPFPEVHYGLQKLKSKGYRLHILSSATGGMLSSALGNSELLSYFDSITSANAVLAYKPSPHSYADFQARIGISKENILFVSGNTQGIAGAKSYGFQAAWINRENEPNDILGFPPDYAFKDVLQLSHALP